LKHNLSDYTDFVNSKTQLILIDSAKAVPMSRLAPVMIAVFLVKGNRSSELPRYFGSGYYQDLLVSRLSIIRFALKVVRSSVPKGTNLIFGVT